MGFNRTENRLYLEFFATFHDRIWRFQFLISWPTTSTFVNSLINRATTLRCFLCNLSHYYLFGHVTGKPTHPLISCGYHRRRGRSSSASCTIDSFIHFNWEIEQLRWLESPRSTLCHSEEWCRTFAIDFLGSSQLYRASCSHN